MGIKEIEKPEGKWCPHVKHGAGCKIYPDRPDSCRVWSCLWLHGAGTEGLWPARSRVVLGGAVYRHGQMVITMLVDPAYPEAWKGKDVAAYMSSVVTAFDAGFFVGIGNKHYSHRVHGVNDGPISDADWPKVSKDQYPITGERAIDEGL